ncbi:DUF4279 domain-containing protein [Streptomyces sp. NPDC041003]
MCWTAERRRSYPTPRTDHSREQGRQDRGSDERQVPAVSAFRMYLRVVSESLQPEEISRRLGAEPDESTSIGSRRRPQLPPRSHSTWIRRADAPEGRGRPEDLEPAVLGWGTDLATALGRLADAGEASVFLEIVQEIRDLDDPQQKGIALSADLMSWLGAARASLDIDQYVYHECGDEPGGVSPSAP